MRAFALKRESLEKGQLSADRSQAADEAFCTGDRALKKGSFPVNDSKAADESILHQEREP